MLGLIADVDIVCVRVDVRGASTRCILPLIFIPSVVSVRLAHAQSRQVLLRRSQQRNHGRVRVHA